MLKIKSEGKMENTTAGLFLALMLLIGLGAGLWIGLNNSKEVVKEVPVEVIKEVEKEVVKEVEKDYLAIGVEQFISNLKLDEYQTISNINLGENWSINFTEDGYLVKFNIEYKIIDTLRNSRKNYNRDISVSYDSEKVKFRVY